MDIILERLKANAIEAGMTPDRHYYEIKEFYGDKTLCYTLYNKKGEKIPCVTDSQEKRYPKRSAKFASDRVKVLSEARQFLNNLI